MPPSTMLQGTENEDGQTLTQSSSMSFSLPIEDIESDDDNISIKLLCKRKRDSQQKTLINKKVSKH
jgi:hypothetical protein